jgi:DNA polymerase III delta prime subunit
MENLNINKILNREEKASEFKEIIYSFEKNKSNILMKKCIYIYGNPGTGKTTFVMNILKELDYDVIKYDAGDIRNKSIIDMITRHNISDKNIMSLFNKKIKRIAIVMDEIDGMNNGDKGGINSLIKLIRPKKTKKQKLEEITLNPIICIGNYHIDKKIKELIKVCNTIELKTPLTSEINFIIDNLMPNIKNEVKNNIIKFIQGDLRKLNNIYNIYKGKESIINNETIENMFQKKCYNDDTKKIIHNLMNKQFYINEHNNIMNETDRTIVGLLWHENIIDVIGKMKPNISIPFYLKQLDNICFSDYIDRITFQKQIWQFNEMSSLIKTFKNNKLYHEYFNKRPKYNPTEVRFTKVLTKYSTEYNNSLFIQNLSHQLGMDKKDLISFFIDISEKYNDNEIMTLFENYDINKLEINRIYRYIDKYIKENTSEVSEVLEENDSIDD